MAHMKPLDVPAQSRILVLFDVSSFQMACQGIQASTKSVAADQTVNKQSPVILDERGEENIKERETSYQ